LESVEADLGAEASGGPNLLIRGVSHSRVC
jgi:hypothetical protein